MVRAKKGLLIVGDGAMVRDLLQRVLERRGYLDGRQGSQITPGVRIRVVAGACVTMKGMLPTFVLR